MMNTHTNTTHRGNVVMSVTILTIIAVCMTALIFTQTGCDPKSADSEDDGFIAEPFSIVYVSERDDNLYYIYKMKSDGSGKVQLAELGEFEDIYQMSERAGRPKWSPNRLEIAFVRDGNIWIMNSSNGSDQRQLTTDGGNSFPAWSPDGRLIAYSSFNTDEIIIIDRNGDIEDKVSRTCQSILYAWPSWSPDGTMIACIDISFLYYNSYQIRISILNWGDSNQGIFGYEHRYPPAWSPDSKYVAYRVRDRGNISKRYVDDGNISAINSQEEQVIVENAECSGYSDGKIIWSPYGTYNKIVYLNYTDGGLNIFMVDGNAVNATGDEITQITNNQYSRISGCDWENSLGMNIVFCGRKKNRGNDDIYITFETGEGFRIDALTEDELCYDGMPDW